jgi:anti-sigma B factor antagonist
MADTNNLVLTSDGQRHLARSRHAAPIGSFAVAGYDAHGGAVVRLTGELDVATVPALAHFLHGLGARERAHLVADLAGLTFCDCAGLNALLDAHHRAVADGGWLRLCAASVGLQKLLKITNLSTALRCYPTVGDAFANPGLPAAEIYR